MLENTQNPFCDPQQQAPFGGIISENQTRLEETVLRWIDAFKSPLISKDAFSFFFDFDKDVISELLNQEGCKGIRIFPGLDEENKIIVSVVGIQANEDNNPIEIFSTGFDGKSKMKVACCSRNGITHGFPPFNIQVDNVKNR